MGNLLPLDAAKKEQCEEIAKEYLATFNVEYVLAYGVEFAKMKIKQIENEVFGDVETKKKLIYRKDFKRTDPHKVGPLTKQGAIIKNWKHRHFVVNPDYSVSYYETEEAYEKSLKPKGVIFLAGYKVKDSADNAVIEQLKALAKKLGIDEESLPLPEKFPPHTLALSHERRREYYITAADEDEKKEWIEMFKTCCRKAKGLKSEDPVAREAFKTAYRRACYESGWLSRKDPSGGTEEQILTETLVEIINSRVLSSVYSDLTGNFTIKKKIQKQVEKTLDSMVLALVKPAYKALVETTEKMKAPVEKTFNEKKDEIVKVQKKITAQISDKAELIVDKIFQDLKEDIAKLYEDLRELTVRTSKEMRDECVVRLMERLVKDTKESEDVEYVMKKYYRTFDNIIYGTCAWDHWYKVYNMEKEAIGIVDKYEGTFDRGGSYRFVYDAHDMLALVADAAFFTFQQTMKERTKDNDTLKDNKKTAEMMEKIKDEIIPKYDHDSKSTPEDVSFALTTAHVLEFVSSKIDPLTKEIRKVVANAIPEPLKQIISIEDQYDLYVEELVKELIRRAIGIPKPEMNGKNEAKTEETKIEMNGKKDDEQMKDSEEAKENETEDKKVEENDQKGGETGKNEVRENGNTDGEISEEKKEVEAEGKENGKNEEEKQEEKKEDGQKESGSEENKENGDTVKESGSEETKENGDTASGSEKSKENGDTAKEIGSEENKENGDTAKEIGSEENKENGDIVAEIESKEQKELCNGDTNDVNELEGNTSDDTAM